MNLKTHAPTSLFAQLDAEAQKILDTFDSIVQDVQPLNSKQFLELPKTIRRLSHELTDERSKRRMGYMNDAPTLSAYTRYYQWWNLFRLTSIFAALPPDSFSQLNDGDYLLDIGSGSLTVPLAIWLARPELRKKKLSCYCLDYSQTALALGENLLLSFAAKTKDEPWRCIRIKGGFGTSIKNKAKFISCANMFNELFWNSKKTLEELVKNYSRDLLSYGTEQTMVFIAEPGIPRSSRFVSLFRDSLLRRQFSILAPCPQTTVCAMPGLRGGKWCHFILSTDSAPKKLHALSDSAGLQKDRAAIAFLLAHNYPQPQNQTQQQAAAFSIRIISDPIKLPSGYGRYCCSSAGLTLITGNTINLHSGTLITLPPLTAEALKNLPVDQKSGAKIIKF